MQMARAQAAAAERELMSARGMLVHEVTAREQAAVENDRLRMDVARLTGEVGLYAVGNLAVST
jgi:hypothetical protein